MLYTTSKGAGRPPSDLLNVREWASSILGMDDIWTPLMLDSAVATFGLWAEGKLNEMDKEGKTVHKLSDLLDDKPVVPDWDAFKAGMTDIQGIGVSRR